MSAAVRAVPDRRGLALLAAGHLGADALQGALPALLPFFIAQRGYSVGSSALLVVALTTSVSVVQPVLGVVADRRATHWLMPAGLACGAAGFVCLCLAPNGAPAMLAALITGLGVGAFHPEAARCAGELAADRPAAAIGVFSFGGNVGFAVSPAVVTPVALLAGVSAGAVVAVLPAIAAVGLARRPPAPTRPAEPPRAPVSRAAAAEAQRSAFRILAAIIAVRSVAFFGFQSFLAAFYVDALGASPATGNLALTLLLVCTAIATVVGGVLGDRIGHERLLLWSMLAAALLLIAFVLVESPAAVVLLALGGACLISNLSGSIVLGQQYLPGRAGFASGVTVGLAVGAGGLFTGVLGVLADADGVRAALLVAAALPLAGAALSLTLPAARRPSLGRSAPGAQGSAA